MLTPEQMSTKDFRPYVTPESKIPEISFLPILMGTILGIVFGASSLYLALKVGMTVSASIPIAVLSITLFRGIAKVFRVRSATILENNIVQTTGSAGESIAFGVAATMPALMILGFDMELSRVITVSVLGGLIGILMMIPLRRALVDEAHEELPFPEGTACAQVLISGEKGGATAATVFLGFFVGLAYKLMTAGMKLWHEVTEFPVKFLRGAVVAAEVSPELLGVGYIIGFRAACLMVGGGILSSFVLIPAIYLFGSLAQEPLFPATKLINDMAPHEIWRNYVLYIGAGSVASAGIISLIRSLPVIIRAAKAGMGQLSTTKQQVGSAGAPRTQKDLSLKVVFGGILAIIVAICLVPALHVNIFAAVLIVAFGFLFVTVSSRITGEIGSSSNPISGMTVATLLITSLIFLALGWTSTQDRLAALSIAAIVCIASSNAGTTAQDLKTGFLVGGTPKYQQIGILIGALTSALIIGVTLKFLNVASTIYSTKDLPQVRVENVSQLTEMAQPAGSENAADKNTYHVLRVTESTAVGALEKVPYGKYLVDDSGAIRYLVDPGINGRLNARDDGTPVVKYEAPKASLMALIIDGILAQKLPWGLILLGVFITLVLELAGAPSLTFAVGVYLPLSTSMPIFVGGLARLFTDKISKKEQDDSGPGVLLSSGLIAGGSIAGILMAVLMVKEDWGKAINFGSLIPQVSQSMVTAALVFAGLTIFLIWQSVKGTKEQ